MNEIYLFSGNNAAYNAVYSGIDCMFNRPET